MEIEMVQDVTGFGFWTADCWYHGPFATQEQAVAYAREMVTVTEVS